MDKIYELMAEMSEILADTDEMRCCVDPLEKYNLRETILRASLGVDKSLLDWREETGALKNFNDGDGEIPQNLPGSSDLVFAHMTLLYRTVQLVPCNLSLPLHRSRGTLPLTR